MVTSSTGATAANCSSSGELFPGKFGFGILTGVNLGAKTLTLSAPIVPTPANIVNSNLAGTSPFCKMQVVRVPNFNNLTLSAGGPIGISPPSYSDTSTFSGGVLVMRVKGILNSSCSGSTCMIGAAGIGYSTATSGNQGSSTAGPGSASTAPNSGGGGGASSGGGGGGGNAGAGANGASAGGSGASGPTCAGAGCFFMGGGGAAGATGGAGGGIIMVFANTISVPVGNLVFEASGGNGGGASNGGGGGAGGTLLVQTTSVQNLFTANANGGAGAGSPTGGGGGGGGSVQYNACTGAPPSINTSGGGGGSGAATGASGFNNGTATNAGQSFCP